MDNTSRKIITDTVNFNSPERLARDCWILPAVMEKMGEEIRTLQSQFPSDFSGDGFHDPLGGIHLYECGVFTDPWGSVWHNETSGILGQVRQFPLSDWKKLGDYSPPYHLIGKGFEKVPDTLATTPDKFHLGIIPSLFHRMCWLATRAMFSWTFIQTRKNFFNCATWCMNIICNILNCFYNITMKAS